MLGANQKPRPQKFGLVQKPTTYNPTQNPRATIISVDCQFVSKLYFNFNTACIFISISLQLFNLVPLCRPAYQPPPPTPSATKNHRTWVDFPILYCLYIHVNRCCCCCYRLTFRLQNVLCVLVCCVRVIFDFIFNAQSPYVRGHIHTYTLTSK